MVSGVWRAVRFELARALRPVRLVCAAVVIVLIGALAYQDLLTEQAAQGGRLLGSTALDVFYLALNNQWCSALLFPLGILFVAGDMLARDQAGSVSSYAVARGNRVAEVAIGKIVGSILCGLAFSLLTCLALTLFDHLVFRTPLMARTVPLWLAYSGNTDHYLRTGELVYALMPASWNYGVTVVLLAVCEGIVSSGVALFFIALASRSSVRMLPILLLSGTFLCLLTLPEIWVKLVFLISGGTNGIVGGVSDVGLVLDRFCLAGYALGAGLWQTTVGGAALLEQELSMNVGPYPDGYLDAIASGYTVNSFGSLIMILIALYLFASIRLLGAVRASCQPGTEASEMSKGRFAFLSREQHRFRMRARRRTPSAEQRDHRTAPKHGAHFACNTDRFSGAEGNNAVEIDGLTLKFGKHTVFDDASFRAASGEVIGLVGENGKGKTTLLMVLAGLLEPNACNGHVLGRDVHAGPDGSCGVLFDNPTFVEERSGIDNLILLSRYCGIPSDDAAAFLRIAGLDPDDRRSVRDYSLGMRKRLGFALASIGDPALLLLDEPFNGIDPAGVVALRERILAYALQGGTAIISSHLLDELQRICDRVYIAQDGKLVEVDYRRDVPSDLEHAYLRLSQAMSWVIE